MLEHNLFLDMLTSLILPLFLLLILGAMVGVKPDTICNGYFKIVGSLLQVGFKFAFQLTILITRELIKLLAQKKTIGIGHHTHFQEVPNKSNIKIVVSED